MKKLFVMLLTLILCLTAASALADVPRSTSVLPAMPGMPDCPQIVRVQKSSAGMTVTLDRPLPAESLVTFLAIDNGCRKADVNAALDGLTYSVTYSAAGLPKGGQWLGMEIAWVQGGVNAVARYNVNGGLESVTRFDKHLNEYVYNSEGVFYEYADSVSDIRARFDTRGRLTCYGYEARRNMIVWFDLAGNILWADYDDGTFAATWETGLNWYVSTPSGRISVKLNASPWGASPLFVEEEEEEKPEYTWYPNNTIGLAGLKLQEASSRLPSKWYNVIPIDLTRQGRQTYFLVISDARFIGECYVDVYGDEVTVSYSLIENSSIEPLSSYGRWFTSLSQVTERSIDANSSPIPFGEPMSISRDLDGVQVALLFIRSKATYCLPFKDGSEPAEYWRNKPEWKEFRSTLQELMKYVEK